MRPETRHSGISLATTALHALETLAGLARAAASGPKGDLGRGGSLLFPRGKADKSQAIAKLVLIAALQFFCQLVACPSGRH